MFARGLTAGHTRTRARRERGAVAVEFALVLPVLVALMFGVFTAGGAYSDHLSVTNAVREAARFGGAVDYSVPDATTWADSVQDRVQQVYMNGLGTLTESQICVRLLDSSGAVVGVPTAQGTSCGPEPRPSNSRAGRKLSREGLGAEAGEDLHAGVRRAGLHDPGGVGVLLRQGDDRVSRQLTRAPRRHHRSRSHDERGAVAILVALFLTALLIGAAMVLDFGLARVDRQVNKSAADAAVVAGLARHEGLRRERTPLRGRVQRHPLPAGERPALQRRDVHLRQLGSVRLRRPVRPSEHRLAEPDLRPRQPDTWARYEWNGTWQGEILKVVIQSGYDISDTNTGQKWLEESLPGC